MPPESPRTEARTARPRTCSRRTRPSPSIRIPFVRASSRIGVAFVVGDALPADQSVVELAHGQARRGAMAAQPPFAGEDLTAVVVAPNGDIATGSDIEVGLDPAVGVLIPAFGDCQGEARGEAEHVASIC